jgi:hypothetical protein
VILGGDGLDRATHQQGVDQTETETDTEEDAVEGPSTEPEGGSGKRGERHAHDEQTDGSEGHCREHQRRVLRWRRHCVTPIPFSRETIPL